MWGMHITVHLFAKARDLAGCRELTIEVPATTESRPTVHDLKGALISNCPALTALAPHLLVALDGAYASDTQFLRADCETACFPPVSGG